MVRRLASPSHLFSRGHDHVAETSRADHYRAPCGHYRIAPLVPTSVGWDDCCISVEVYKGNPSTALLLPSLACFRAHQCRRSCFPLQLVLANPPLAHFCHCSAHSPSKLSAVFVDNLQKKLRRRPREEPQLSSLTWLSSWRCLSPSAGRL
jgi:hypothetical protein